MSDIYPSDKYIICPKCGLWYNKDYEHPCPYKNTDISILQEVVKIHEEIKETNNLLRKLLNKKG